MPDHELMDMELERLNKKLDVYESEQGRQLAVLVEKLQKQIKCQNNDTELYGKNSFAATLNRQLVNAWIFAIENYGWHVELDFRGDLISEMWIYAADLTCYKGCVF